MYILNFINDYTKEESSFRWAIHDSNNELVHKMIHDNRKLKNHVLHMAARLGNLEILKHYISAGVDVNRRGIKADKGFTPLQRAVIKNKYEAVKLLIEAGANLNSDAVGVCNGNCSILNLAINDGPRNLEILKLLLSHKANVNQSCDQCYSPLVKAIEEHREEIVQVLLEHGAGVNLLCNDFGDQITPLHMAVKQNQLEIVKMLLSKNANVNAVSSSRKESVLHSGIRVFVRPNVVKCVLTAGFDVNLEDSDDRTVLELERSRNTKSAMVIREHLVKMKAAGLQLSAKNMEAIDREELEELFDSCCEEIELMKKTRIPNTLMTFYDLVCEQDVASGIRCVSNVLNYCRNFPLYCDIINFKLKKN